ncbi:MAG: DUF2804 domain-containing protein [Polyangiaceae bacterium]
MMRELEPTPHTLIDVSKPRFGSFSGGLPRIDLGSTGRSTLWNFAHEKRWIYAGVANEAHYVGVAVVSLGYAATAIVYVFDRRTGRMLFDRSFMAPPTAVRFEDDGPGARRATFAFGRTRIDLSDRRVRIDAGDKRGPLFVDVTTRAIAAPAIGAVVPIPSGFASATEKRLFEGEGELVAESKRLSLGGSLVALDHTRGFLARRTVWRWALGLGRLASGERVAFNVVEGFVGEPECVAWVGDALVPLGEGRISFDQPMGEWRLDTTCGALSVVFRPSALHSEEKNLGVVKSSFIQPVGAFDGTLRVGDETHALTRIAGVTEHQDVLW